MNEKKEQPKINPFGTGMFVELTDESKQQILADKTLSKKSSLINEDTKIIPLNGNLAFVPNK